MSSIFSVRFALASKGREIKIEMIASPAPNSNQRYEKWNMPYMAMLKPPKPIPIREIDANFREAFSRLGMVDTFEVLGFWLTYS